MNLENLFVQYKVMLFRKQIERLNKSGTFDFISTNVIFSIAVMVAPRMEMVVICVEEHEYELQYEVVT